MARAAGGQAEAAGRRVRERVPQERGVAVRGVEDPVALGRHAEEADPSASLEAVRLLRVSLGALAAHLDPDPVSASTDSQAGGDLRLVADRRCGADVEPG